MSGTGTGSADPATGSASGGDSTATDPSTTTPPTTETTATTDPGTGDATATDSAKEVEKWKALARKHEARSKENATAATKLAEIENASKSELQKAQDRAAAAEKLAQDSDSARYRLLAAAGNGLGPDMVDFLGSGTEDEIGERAKALAAVIKSEADKLIDPILAQFGVTRNGQNGTANSAAAAASQAIGRRPVESMRPGGVPATDHVTPASNNDLFRQMYERSQQR